MVIYSKWFCELFNIRGCAWFPGIAIVKYKEWNAVENHEKIHLQHQLELLYVGFIVLYLYFLITKGYDNNPFEKECFNNEQNLDYISSRKWYSWKKYI